MASELREGLRFGESLLLLAFFLRRLGDLIEYHLACYRLLVLREGQHLRMW